MSYNILLLGTTRVGKTNYIRRLSSESYRQQYEPTSHITFTDICLRGKHIRVYDTVGSFKYNMKHHNIYQSVHGILMFFDITRTITRQYVRDMIHQLHEEYPYIPIQVVATKCDIPHPPVRCMEDLDFIMISSKNNTNISIPVWNLVRKMERNEQKKTKQSYFSKVKQFLKKQL